MPDSPTPGELCYAAYMLNRYRVGATEARWFYANLEPRERTAWEAAAQAVLALKEKTHDPGRV